MEVIFEPLNYAFFRAALTEIVIIAILTSLVGVFVVVRNLAYMGEALSHGVFPGLVLAFIFKVNLLAGAIFTAILTAIGVTLTSSDKKITETNAIGILNTSAFALGVVIISATGSYKLNLTNLLIGEILGVTNSDIMLSLGALLLVIFLILMFYRSLVVSSFDREFASSIGVNVRMMDLLLYVLIAIAVVITVQSVGTVLVSAVILIPAASARLTNKRLPQMIFTAMIYSLLCGVLGLYLTFYWKLATGATIVLLNSALFYVIFCWQKFSRKKNLNY